MAEIWYAAHAARLKEPTLSETNKKLDEIALRDALMFASGLPIDGDTPTDAASLEEGYAAKAKAERA